MKVQSADGVIHEFPEGTPDAVIDKAMKQYANQPKPGVGEKTGVAFTSMLSGAPVIGPALKAGTERLAAGVESVITGKPYGESLKSTQEKFQQAEARNPVVKSRGETAGGVAGTLAAGAAAPWAMGISGTMPGMMVRGGLSGLAMGAGDAAVRGENPTVPGLVSGAAGVAGPIVGRGVEAAAQPVINALRGIRDAPAEAGRRIVAAGDLGQRTGQTGLTPQQFVGAQRAGQPVMNIDLGGTPMAALARSAANTDPGARNILDTALNQRQAQQGERVTRFLNREFHFPDPARTEAALEQAAQTTNDVAYRRAYQQGSQGLMSPRLQELVSSKAVGTAVRRAVDAWGEEAVISGHGAMRPHVTFTPDGRIEFPRGPKGVPAYPDLQFWDLARRELSSAANVAKRTGHDTEYRRLSNAARELNRELDRLVPSYAQARAGAASFFQAENALEAGQKAVRSRMGNDALRQNVARMKPVERHLFQDGYVGQWVQHIREQPDNKDLSKLFRSPAWRERNEIVLGRDKARRVEAMMLVERVMAQSRNAVQGNSTTARQLHELGMAGGYGGIAAIGTELYDKRNDQLAILNAMLVHGAARGKMVIDRRVAEQVAQLLVADNPQALQRGIQVVANNTQMMDALISTLARGAARMVTPRSAPQPEQKPIYGGPQQ